MREYFVRSSLVLAMLIVAPLVGAQTAPPPSGKPLQTATTKDKKAAPTSSEPVDFDGWGRSMAPESNGRKSRPAPRHDISGTWDPATGPNDGGQFYGAEAVPEDGKPGHQPPYTRLGLEALYRTKPSNGARMVPPGETNDPEAFCDPQGFPREDLFQLRTTQIVQTAVSVVILYEYDRVWRVIWTDGRELPKDPERGSAIPLANGRTITHLSSRRQGLIKEPGWTTQVVRIAVICAWKRNSIASTMII